LYLNTVEVGGLQHCYPTGSLSYTKWISLDHIVCMWSQITEGHRTQPAVVDLESGGVGNSL